MGAYIWINKFHIKDLLLFVYEKIGRFDSKYLADALDLWRNISAFIIDFKSDNLIRFLLPFLWNWRKKCWTHR